MASFFDTNILIYADDNADTQKQLVASKLIANAYVQGNAVISAQVMQEYYNVAVNKLKIEAAFAAQRLRFFAKFEVVSATPQLVIAATELHRLHQLSFWDAMIVQSAITSGCNTLFSRDMNDGQIIQGVKITNPFEKKAT
jgi:predicted nucleic acid-binding protein